MNGVLLPATAGPFSLYTEGWDLVLQPFTLAVIFLGVLVGMVVGAIPGLTANMSVGLLVPLTFTMSPTDAIALLAGVWLGSLYGGTIPAVLINMPGTPADLMTTIDGYPMSRRGEGGRAIGIGVLSSFAGGTLSVLLLGTFGPSLAGLARQFGSGEYLAVAVLGLAVIAFVSGTSLLKGLAAALLGLLIGLVGRDLNSGQERFTFGQPELLGGIEFIAVIIGIFGMAEVIEQAWTGQARVRPRPQRISAMSSAFRDVLPLKGVVARSSVIGTLVGVLPGAGATIASVISYGTQKRLSRRPEEMGKGAPEGVAASDSANNAASGGAMTTMLSIGIPGDALTAILIGALVVQGVQPGPRLFEGDLSLVSSIFISLLIANVCLLVVGMLVSRQFARLLSVPRGLLLPGVAVVSVVGTYAINNSTFDVAMMLLAAVVGFCFARADIPKAPLVLALILGPILETNLRRLLQLNDDSVVGVVGDLAGSPIALGLLLVSLVLLLLPALRGLGRRRRTGSALDPATTKES